MLGILSFEEYKHLVHNMHQEAYVVRDTFWKVTCKRSLSNDVIIVSIIEYTYTN
jgi:hypothetical protein